MPWAGKSPGSPNTMTPLPHHADAPRRASHTTCERPSAIDIFLIVSPLKKPTHWPSGEKNGSRTSIASPTTCSDAESSLLSTRRGA